MAPALVLAGVLVLCAGSAWALPATTSTTIEAKTAQQKAAQAELEAKQLEVDAKVAEYMALGRQLERTRAEVSELATQLAAGEIKLIKARSALTSRAVEIYRAPQMGIVEIFIGTSSLQDLFARARYLAIISDHDARLMRDYRLTQSENLFLQQGLADREANLAMLQGQADEQSKQILVDMAALEAQTKALGADVARLVTEAATPALPTGGTPSGKFQRETVISQNNFRAANSMSAAGIQKFLESQPGALKSYVGPDHAGVRKTAAEMIADASVNFNVNPKVILATLQKEQSLLSAKSPTQSQYNGAMGAGMPDSGKNNSSMQGFGNQIWWGAQKQNKNALDWRQGASEAVDGTKVYPTNEGTFAQYRYTPHFSGVMSFWMIYWRYFGDPLA
jgi:peptidoglycan hydrolase CwlO-like protein